MKQSAVDTRQINGNAAVTGAETRQSHAVVLLVVADGERLSGGMVGEGERLLAFLKRSLDGEGEVNVKAE